MMHLATLVSLVICVIQTKNSLQDCRIMADCDEGQVQWMNLQRGASGQSGKKGPPGPQGQKGEPGLGMNLTEIKSILNDDKKGPQRYYYTSTLTWETSKAFCQAFNRTLCLASQLCHRHGGGRKFIHDIIPGDHWVAILNSQNEWLEIGDYHVKPCSQTTEGWGYPSWGVSSAAAGHKGYVYCCEKSPEAEILAPDIKYQFIGTTATYESSRRHCESLGRRLCYSSEVCSQNKPRFGALRHDKWVPVNDRTNDWIQIGTNGRICGMHGIQHGLPSWGIRTDGSTCNFVGYVYCCKHGAR